MHEVVARIGLLLMAMLGVLFILLAVHLAALPPDPHLFGSWPPGVVVGAAFTMGVLLFLMAMVWIWYG